MSIKIPRRDFLKAAPLAAYALAQTAKGATLMPPAALPKTKLDPFDYQGVRLLPSRWQQQFQAARDFYLGLSDDDILCGYRRAAGLPAPGKPLGGWCAQNSSTVFGQWLSGMSRIFRATGDGAMRDKAVKLFTEWAKTIGPDGNCRMSHYAIEKLVCGLVDLHFYAGYSEAGALLEKVTDWAEKALSRQNTPASPERASGSPGEWYTLSENLYRASQLLGNPKYQKFGDAWLYHAYWDKFADSAAPANAFGLHGYSHVNTFSSAAMAYAVTGEDRYLQVIKNAYDWLQNLQCYSTGGYGPSETIVGYEGALGRVLEVRSDTFETPCGSWAAFKLARYLQSFTGEARYGDWAERILYNGIGAALPVTPEGKTFYYADYRVGGGMKVYYWDRWPCCSGSYIQAVSDYPNLIYYKDASSLYVNLFVASELTWSRPDSEVKLVQETSYPESETTTLKLELKSGTRFGLKFRVPTWAREVAVKINGETAAVECRPGTWASMDRTWNSGDQIEVRIPQSIRLQAVDKQHPERVAAVRGPVALVMEGLWQETQFVLPRTDAEFERMLTPDRTPGVFQVRGPNGTTNHSKFRPFYTVAEATPYYMYFDKQSLPVSQW